MQRTAKDLGTPGKDTDYGAGRIQLKEAVLRIVHTVVVDDITVAVTGGYINLYCNQTDDTLFECTCYGGGDEIDFEIEAEDDIQACSDGGEMCLELIDIDAVMSGGGGGGGYFPPPYYW